MASLATTLISITLFEGENLSIALARQKISEKSERYLKAFAHGKNLRFHHKKNKAM